MKDIQDRIREVAYVMWESAGRQHGMAMEYWLAAEREVVSTMQAATERMMPGQGAGSSSDEVIQAEGGKDQLAKNTRSAEATSAPSSPAAAERTPQPPAEPAAAPATRARPAASGRPAGRKSEGRVRSKRTSES